MTKLFNTVVVALGILVCAALPVDRYQQVRFKWDLQKIEKYKQAVGLIEVVFKDGNVFGGAGVVIGTDGTTLTAAHLFNHGQIETIIMSVPNGNVYEMDGLAINTRNDLALIRPKAAAPGFKYIRVHKGQKIDPNQEVAVIGHPLWLVNHVEYGVVLGTQFDIFYMGEIVKISALVRPGNSGGPVLSTKGEVVGIVSARAVHPLTWEYSHGIAISLKEIHEFMKMAQTMEPYWPKQIKRHRLAEFK